MRKIILIIVLVLFVGIQFLQVNKHNPPVDNTQNFVDINGTPDDIKAMLQATCYDCHSNETHYPWYTYINPIGWFLKYHIDEGREELNFSEWGSYDAKRKSKKLDEITKMIEKRKMPLLSYRILHWNTFLDVTQTEQFINYFDDLKSPPKEPVLDIDHIEEHGD